MTAKSILNMFEEYRRARTTFVQTTADLALRPQNLDLLRSSGVLELLRPLLSDVCAQIQQCAAVALGRLAHHDATIAGEMLRGGLLRPLLSSLEQRNKHYKKSAMFVLRSVCRHDAETAEEVLSSGGLEALVMCLADHDAEVKESAAWACGCAARHGHASARALCDAGAVAHLVLSLQQPELGVRRVAAGALADVARHGCDLGQHVADAGAVPFLARALGSRDDRLRRQALAALAAVARHSVALAETVVQADVLPAALGSLGHSGSSASVRRNAAALLRDTVRHSSELAQLVANLGGVGALARAVRDPEDEVRAPAVAALGYAAGHAAPLAACVASCDGVAALAGLLDSAGRHDELLCSAVWALGQLARHCPAAVAQHAGLLERLLRLYAACAAAGGGVTPRASLVRHSSGMGASLTAGLDAAAAVRFGSSGGTDDVDYTAELRARCKTALRQAVQGCATLSAIEPLLHAGCPPDILKNVLGQFAKILPKEPRARRLFVTTGGLQKVQEIECEPGSTTMEYIATINACFPEEIVRYYTPGYPDSLLEQVEQFVPRVDVSADVPTEPRVLEPPSDGPPPSVSNSQDLLDCVGRTAT